MLLKFIAIEEVKSPGYKISSFFAESPGFLKFLLKSRGLWLCRDGRGAEVSVIAHFRHTMSRNAPVQILNSGSAGWSCVVTITTKHSANKSWHIKVDILMGNAFQGNAFPSLEVVSFFVESSDKHYTHC